MKLGALIGTTGVTALTIPSSTTSDTYFNATQQLEDAHINYKHFLIGTRAGSRVPDYVGPRLADKWDTMGELYKVFIYIDLNQPRNKRVICQIWDTVSFLSAEVRGSYHLSRAVSLGSAV